MEEIQSRNIETSEYMSERRKAGLARLSFHLMCNDMLDEALAGNRTIHDAGETIKSLRPMILGEEG